MTVVSAIETTPISGDEGNPSYTADGEEIVSTQTVSSKTRTVETITVSEIFKFQLKSSELLS